MQPNLTEPLAPLNSNCATARSFCCARLRPRKLRTEGTTPMPDKPTAKPFVASQSKRRPTRIDDATWALFARACGGRCCTPDCDAVHKLEQGHITRHADGGQLVFENLIPLCKSCNAKHKGGFTPDTRPAGWRTAFWTLLLAENQIQIRWQHLNRGDNTSPGKQAIDSNGFIDLQAVEFVAT